MGISTTGTGGTITTTADVPASGGASVFPQVSYVFDGSTDSMETTSGNFGTPLNTKFAISCWFNIDELPSVLGSGTKRIFTVQDTGGNILLSLRAGGTSDDRLKADITFSSSGTINLHSSTGIITKTTWHHAALIVDTTQATAADRAGVYFDGSEITYNGSQEDPSDISQSDTATFSGASIGNISWSSHQSPIGTWVSNSHFGGKLFQMAFFDGNGGDLPTIGDLYNSGSPTDITGIDSLSSLLYDSSDSTTSGDPLVDFELSSDWTVDTGASQTSPTLNSDIPS